jgi:hypothetical protein
MYETPLGAGSDVHPQHYVKLDVQRFVEFLDAQDDTVGPKPPHASGIQAADSTHTA